LGVRGLPGAGHPIRDPELPAYSLAFGFSRQLRGVGNSPPSFRVYRLVAREAAKIR
jgi:hypothetical protein